MNARPASVSRTAVALLLTGLGLTLLVLSLVAPVNHDESQYFAAAELTVKMRPFQDFLYHQTPIQPYLSAPIAALSERYSFVMLRLANGLVGFGALVLVYLCQRRLKVSREIALLMTLLLALTHPFQFGATVVRNDMLPALLAGLGVLAAISALDSNGKSGVVLWMAAGFALSAAAGTKITYALHAAAAGLFLMVLWARGEGPRKWLTAYVLGCVISLSPVLMIRAKAPAAFDYGVFEFNARTSLHFYEANGRPGLDLTSKLLDTLRYLLGGPGLLALILVFSALGRRPRDGTGQVRLLLELLVLAGLAAALLPTPTWKQYLIPLLIPLFILLGLVVADGRRPSARWSWFLGAALLAGIGIGLHQPGKWLARAVTRPENVLAMTEEAHWIGDRIRAARAQGTIATLSPQAVLDSGFELDRRFATGPFFYRTGDLVDPARQRALHAISPGTLETFLAEEPPAAIVTGYEGKPTRSGTLDEGLRSFATRHGYVKVRSPFGKAELYIAPSDPPG